MEYELSYKSGRRLSRDPQAVLNATDTPHQLQRETSAPTRTGVEEQATASMASIVVEPPAQAQREVVLYPPLVVNCSDPDMIFQIRLIDSRDHAVGALRGTPSASPHLLASPAGGSRGSVNYAVFPDLAITISGTYRLQVNGFKMDYAQMPPVMVHVTQSQSRRIRVRSSEVAQEQPAGSESRLLAALSRAGFPVN